MIIATIKWAVGISTRSPWACSSKRSANHQPVVAMPFSTWAQISFPAVQDAIRKLSDWCVTVLVGDEIYEQHEPGTGEHYVHLFPWYCQQGPHHPTRQPAHTSHEQMLRLAPAHLIHPHQLRRVRQHSPDANCEQPDRTRPPIRNCSTWAALHTSSTTSKTRRGNSLAL